MNNSILLINPYKWNGMWVFDDERVGLDKEPFVAGADTMIDTAVQLKGIPNAENGFLLMFSAGPFPDADFDLEWLREESGGNVYRGRFEVEGDVREMEGWLCPALNLYYPDAPKRLYVQVREAKKDASARTASPLNSTSSPSVMADVRWIASLSCSSSMGPRPWRTRP